MVPWYQAVVEEGYVVVALMIFWGFRDRKSRKSQELVPVEACVMARVIGFENLKTYVDLEIQGGLRVWAGNRDNYPEFSEMFDSGDQSEIILMFDSLDVKVLPGSESCSEACGFTLVSGDAGEPKFRYEFLGEVARVVHRHPDNEIAVTRAIIGQEIRVCSNIVTSTDVKISAGVMLRSIGWFSAYPLRLFRVESASAN